jgi:hypothetical protein
MSTSSFVAQHTVAAAVLSTPVPARSTRQSQVRLSSALVARIGWDDLDSDFVLADRERKFCVKPIEAESYPSARAKDSLKVIPHGVVIEIPTHS